MNIDELIDNLQEAAMQIEYHDTLEGRDILVSTRNALRNAFVGLEQQLAAERDLHRWIPVSEKLPEPGIYVLVTLMGNKSALMMSLDYDKNSWRNTMGWPFALSQYDCWQPISPVQQEGEK
jgi:hypothetical protein